MFRRGCNVAVVGRTAAPAAPLSSKRHALVAKPMHSDYPAHYNPQQKLVAGADISLKMTEFYDGFTDDFGVFKEGPPTTLRYEYLRAPEHVSALNLHARHLWCPFQSGTQLRSYSPHFRDYGGLSSRDQFGHRSGYMPGDKFKMGHYERKERFWSEESYSMNNKPEMRVPKWLAVVINDEFGKGLIGFFLYAHGGYCCEYLSHKQLPRLVYNKPHLGYLPTVGQTVELSEVTFGKELHSLQMYHSTGHTMCVAGGSAAVVLRGSEPNLVPILLPSKEVRLFDTVNRAVFGRRAGLLSNQTRCQGMAMHRRYIRDRPRVRMLSRRVGSGPNTGGIDKRRNAPWRLDWRWLQAINFRTKYFLSGYILRGRQYTKHKSVADLKAKTYGWDSRDPLYR